MGLYACRAFTTLLHDLTIMLSIWLILVGTVNGAKSIKLGELLLWEDSAYSNVLMASYAMSYLFFRNYLLNVLAAAGYLDHLLDEMPEDKKLREIEGVGGKVNICATLSKEGTTAEGGSGTTTIT